MQFLRQHITFRLLCLFMAIHIFNWSVDAPDAQPDYIPEDLSYNDMESVAEILLEKVFDIKDAISEHDEKDTNDGIGVEYKKDFFYKNETTILNNKIFDYGFHIIALNDYDGQYISQFHLEIVPPPPKA